MVIERMKKNTTILSIFSIILAMALVQSCGSKRDPGRVYMPDMQYSRAFEAYLANDLAEQEIHYVPYPVEGTIRRGDLFPYPLPNDSNGYKMSGQVQNPLPTLSEAKMKEAERLFNVNCAICHGVKMDAQGPLATGQKIPAVANLTLQIYKDMPEGTMFHSITYGKGNMGSYASQLTRQERWMVISYVKSVQKGQLAPGATTDSTAAGGEKMDSTASN